MEGIDLRIFGLALPLVLGAVQVIKQTGLPDRWAGLVAVACGFAIGIMIRVAGVGEGNAMMAGLTGVIAGLSAAGAWSGTKAAITR